jgi:hypothetical protein
VLGKQDPEDPSGFFSTFFSALYDMEFKKPIAKRVIPLLYWLLVTLSSLGAVVAFSGLVIRGGVGIVAAILFVPLCYFATLIFYRVGLEVLLLVFRMADDVQAIRHGGAGAGAGAGPAPGGPYGGGGTPFPFPYAPEYPPAYPGDPGYPATSPGAAGDQGYTYPAGEPPDDRGYRYPAGEGGEGQDPPVSGDDEPWIT